MKEMFIPQTALTACRGQGECSSGLSILADGEGHMKTIPWSLEDLEPGETSLGQLYGLGLDRPSLWSSFSSQN